MSSSPEAGFVGREREGKSNCSKQRRAKKVNPHQISTILFLNSRVVSVLEVILCESHKTCSYFHNVENELIQKGHF